ncbi:MAG: 3-deoxy-D-manno-octulosonic acid transferase [Proteobacteria bacterium]|nr:3-deoxy-D-manno-octulosonic acid transferase [Pseudomonadota bacterium]
MYFLYQILGWASLPIAILRVFLRSRMEASYRKNLSERFGLLKLKQDKPVIWLHAVSVGEVLSCQQLVEHLESKYNEYNVLITCTTPSGRETAKKFSSTRVSVSYLPFDINPFISTFIRRIKPIFLLVMETEIWPTLYKECSKHGIPIFMLNARLSEKSMRGYLKFKTLSRQTIECVTGILAQTESDASRLSRIGGKEILVTGNLKFDRRATSEQIKLGQRFRELFGEKRHIVVAASTQDAEETLIIDSFIAQCPADCLLVLVPRHARRFPLVMELIQSRGLKAVKRSLEEPVPADCRIVLGDSMGEMYSYYACSDVVIMGGSFVSLGGQNPLEALSIGKYVIMGPHTFNFSDIVAKGITAGVICATQNINAAMSSVNDILSDSDSTRIRREVAIQFVDENVGALQKTINYLESQRKTWRTK